MRIECSNCGARQAFKYSEKNVNSLIAFGWRNYDYKLYCPKCMANPVKRCKAYLEWFYTFGKAVHIKDVIKKIWEENGDD